MLEGVIQAASCFPGMCCVSLGDVPEHPAGGIAKSDTARALRHMDRWEPKAWRPKSTPLVERRVQPSARFEYLAAASFGAPLP
jgi:hypothetical protein